MEATEGRQGECKQVESMGREQREGRQRAGECAQNCVQAAHMSTQPHKNRRHRTPLYSRGAPTVMPTRHERREIESCHAYEREWYYMLVGGEEKESELVERKRQRAVVFAARRLPAGARHATGAAAPAPCRKRVARARARHKRVIAATHRQDVTRYGQEAGSSRRNVVACRCHRRPAPAPSPVVRATGRGEVKRPRGKCRQIVLESRGRGSRNVRPAAARRCDATAAPRRLCASRRRYARLRATAAARCGSAPARQTTELDRGDRTAELSTVHHITPISIKRPARRAGAAASRRRRRCQDIQPACARAPCVRRRAAKTPAARAAVAPPALLTQHIRRAARALREERAVRLGGGEATFCARTMDADDPSCAATSTEPPRHPPPLYRHVAAAHTTTAPAMLAGEGSARRFTGVVLLRAQEPRSPRYAAATHAMFASLGDSRVRETRQEAFTIARAQEAGSQRRKHGAPMTR